mmetsp:Transcript_36177/g.109363  ORF Transcript_36177/g.109363 Transcript_36177/m.109363 type:complete len:206 (-) Transcript_36177:201-818(-)
MLELRRAIQLENHALLGQAHGVDEAPSSCLHVRPDEVLVCAHRPEQRGHVLRPQPGAVRVPGPIFQKCAYSAVVLVRPSKHGHVHPRGHGDRLVAVRHGPPPACSVEPAIEAVVRHQGAAAAELRSPQRDGLQPRGALVIAVGAAELALGSAVAAWSFAEAGRPRPTHPAGLGRRAEICSSFYLGVTDCGRHAVRTALYLNAAGR